MEFQFNVNEYFKKPIVEIRNTLLPPDFAGDRRALWNTVNKVAEVVNEMGEASAHAQGLNKPITTAERLRQSDQSLYLLVDNDENNGNGAVTGMLKVGRKGLYVFDREGQHYQVSPPCVLDFYVHEKKQRSGLGKKLFEFMLEKENVKPHNLAIDRPSEKFLNFLRKHYYLQNPIKQMNNYVVFDGFFPDGQKEQSESSPMNRTNGLQSTQSFNSPSYGRYGAPRPPCSMGQIIHNTSSQKNSESASPGVPKKNSSNPEQVVNSPIEIQNNNNSVNRIPNQQYCFRDANHLNSNHEERKNHQQPIPNHNPLQEQMRMFPERELPMRDIQPTNSRYLPAEISQINSPNSNFVRHPAENVWRSTQQIMYQEPPIIPNNNFHHQTTNPGSITQQIPLQQSVLPVQNSTQNQQYIIGNVPPSQYQNTSAHPLSYMPRLQHEHPNNQVHSPFVQNNVPNQQFVQTLPAPKQQNNVFNQQLMGSQQMYGEVNKITPTPQYSVLNEKSAPEYEQTGRVQHPHSFSKDGHHQQQYYHEPIQRNITQPPPGDNQLANQNAFIGHPSYQRQELTVPIQEQQKQQPQMNTFRNNYPQEPIFPSVPTPNEPHQEKKIRFEAKVPYPENKEPETVGSLLQVDPKYFKSDPINLKQPPITPPTSSEIQPNKIKTEDTVASLLKAEEEYFEGGLLRDKYRIPLPPKTIADESYIRSPEHSKFCPNDHCIHQHQGKRQPKGFQEMKTHDQQISNNGSIAQRFAENITYHQGQGHINMSPQQESQREYIRPQQYAQIPTTSTAQIHHENLYSPSQGMSAPLHVQQVYSPEMKPELAQRTFSEIPTSSRQGDYFQHQMHQPNEYVNYIGQANAQQQLSTQQTHNIPQPYVMTQGYQPPINYAPSVPTAGTHLEKEFTVQQQAITPQETQNNPLPTEELRRELQQTQNSQREPFINRSQVIVKTPSDMANTENRQVPSQQVVDGKGDEMKLEPQIMKGNSMNVSKAPIQRFPTTIKQNTFVASDSNAHGEGLRNESIEIASSSNEQKKKENRMYGLNDIDVRRSYRSVILKKPMQSQEDETLENGYPAQVQIVTKKRPPPRTILTMRGR